MIRQLKFLTILAVLGGATPVAAAPLLAVDINDRTIADTPNTPAGFSPYVINSTTNSTGIVNGYTVNFTAFDSNGATGGAAAFDDRDRDTPNTTPNLNEIYDDLIFVGNSAGPTGGLDMRVSGGALRPNRSYFVSIYAYDGIDQAGGGGSATPVRSANWFDGNNLDTLMFNATFVTNVRPVNDDSYKFTGVAVTDANGQLFLKGRRVTATDVAVYVNGFEIVPEPMSLILAGVCLPLAALAARRRPS